MRSTSTVGFVLGACAIPQSSCKCPHMHAALEWVQTADGLQRRNNGIHRHIGPCRHEKDV